MNPGQFAQHHLSSPDPKLLFLPSLFHEAMDIIFDSYEYFQVQDEQDDGQMPPYMRSLISAEMSRITMRLTSVMAWLMARKAVCTGQISHEQACAEYRIDGAELCLEHRPELDSLLPEHMSDLLEKSHALYARVWRLDNELQRQGHLWDAAVKHVADL